MNLNQLRMEKRLWYWSTFQNQFTDVATKVVAVIPIFGYLVLFNDTISDHLSFDTLTGTGNLFFSSSARIRLIYFGILFIGIGWVLFKLRAPSIIQDHDDPFEYRDFAIRHFRFLDFVNLFRKLEDLHGYGKFDDTQFSRVDFYDFVTGSVPELATADLNESDDDSLWFYASKARSFPHTVDRDREFLSDLISIDFMIQNRSRPVSLNCANGSLIFGFLLVALPACDVFVAICMELLASLLGQ